MCRQAACQEEVVSGLSSPSGLPEAELSWEWEQLARTPPAKYLWTGSPSGAQIEPLLHLCAYLL